MAYDSGQKNTATAKEDVGEGRSGGGKTPQAPQAGEPEASQTVHPTKFITLIGNGGPGGALRVAPGDPPKDSDDEGDCSSKCAEAEKLSLRNRALLRKYKIKVQSSSPDTGYGLFAHAMLDAGYEVPVKGPWFKSVEALTNYLSELHPRTREQFATRIVEVTLLAGDQGGEEGKAEKAYLVMTSLVGMVNHFRGLATRPNCRLTWDPSVPLSDYSLKLQTTTTVPEGKELVINYGAAHPVGAMQTKRRRVMPQKPPQKRSKCEARVGVPKKGGAEAAEAGPLAA